MVKSIIQLRCDCNNYPWGKQGKQSLAAQLCSKTPGTGFKIDDGKNYAEMWMGTYPELPSRVLETDEVLQDVLNANKEQLIGKQVLSKFGTDLPFLPKILSIEKALPLQIHPDIELSKKLHQRDPEKFPDENHKPEIAVALSRFEAFCGFKTTDEIKALLALKPLEQFQPKESSWTNETLRQISKEMLTASEDTVAKALDGLQKVPKAELGRAAYVLDLIPRLVDQYGKSDNGNLVSLVLMNYLVLQPGEALWIPADGIHAYLYGDIVECMARSNNVLNTGFCPRADRDSVDVFTQALTFEQHDGKTPMLPRSKSEYSATGKTTAFKPPLSEFNMLVTELKSGDQDTIHAIKGPSIAFVTKGQGKMKADGEEVELRTGYIYFIGQDVEVVYKSTSDDFTVFRAYAV